MTTSPSRRLLCVRTSLGCRKSRACRALERRHRHSPETPPDPRPGLPAYHFNEVSDPYGVTA